MNRIVKSLALLLALSVVFAACSGGGGGSAATAGGSGTVTGTFTKTVAPANDSAWAAPFDSFGDNHEQHLILASDINASGYIQSLSLRLNVTGTSGITCPSLAVKMGHTSLTGSTMTDTFANNVQEGRGSLVTVRNAASFTIPATSAGEYFTINLDTPFNYNGIDNLIVEIVKIGACSGDISLDAAATPDSYTLHTYASGSATGALYDEYLNIMFNFAGGDNTAVPTTGGSNSYPFTSVADGQKIQMLYLATEINGSGPITGIAFPIGTATTVGIDYTVNLRLGHTTRTELTTSFAGNLNVGSPVTAASGLSFHVPAGMPIGSYVWVPLPNGIFTYDGTHNLIVEIEVTTASGMTFLQNNSATNRRLYAAVGSDTGALGDMRYGIKLRFAGGTMDIIGSNDGGTFVFDTMVGGRQFLLRSAELGTSGSINKLACRLAYALPNISYPNFTVTLAHRSQNTLDAVDANNIAGGTLVYSGTFVSPNGQQVGDWIEIPFTTPFNYNGVDNLVVQTTTGAGSNVNSCQLSTGYATWYADRVKLTGGGTPMDMRGNFKLWISK